jgi:hypothetical protein
MSLKSTAAALMLLAASVACHADNARLQALVDEDQADREHVPVPVEPARADRIVAHDRARRDAVRAMLAASGLRSAADYENAALIFQHGQNVDDYRLALSLATISATLEPGRAGARHLLGMTWDRLMLKLGKPQWYGTQVDFNERTKQWELAPIDDAAVTDEERYRLDLPSLALAREHARQMN